MTTAPVTHRTVPDSPGWSHALRSGFANRLTAPHKSTVTFYKDPKELLCLWVGKGALSVIFVATSKVSLDFELISNPRALDVPWIFKS